MKKIATIALFLLLGIGPASVWASALDATCSESHHGMTQAMDNCHVASCCVVTASSPGSSSRAEQLKRAPSIAVQDTALETAANDAPCLDRRDGGPPSPAASQTTPILRR